MVTKDNIKEAHLLHTRLLKKDELDLYLNHLHRLDLKTREQRFDYAICDKALETHCNSINKQETRILGAFIDNKMRGTCEISKRFYLNRSPVRELAFSVEADFQGHKIGSTLMKKALRLINPSSAVIYCQLSNLGMIALAEKFEANITLKRDHVVSKLRYKQKTKKKISLNSNKFEMVNLSDLVSINPHF